MAVNRHTNEKGHIEEQGRMFFKVEHIKGMTLKVENIHVSSTFRPKLS